MAVSFGTSVKSFRFHDFTHNFIFQSILFCNNIVLNAVTVEQNFFLISSKHKLKYFVYFDELMFNKLIGNVYVRSAFTN